MNVLQRRAAERVPPPEPLPGMVGETPMHVVEIARLGCRIAHEPRLPVGSKWNVSFRWGSDVLRFRAELVWSQLMLTSGKKSYESGLRFNDEDVAELEKLKRILTAYLTRSLEGTVPPAQPEGDEAPPFMSAPFLGDPDGSGSGEVYREYRLVGGKWQSRDIEVPLQPRDGFCLPESTPAEEVEGYKTSYMAADEATRRMIRASLEMTVR